MIKINFILVLIVLITILIVIKVRYEAYANFNVKEKESLSSIVMSHVNHLIVDKKMLMELIEEARKQGVMLNIAAYVYNDATGMWDRARTLCEK